MKTILVAIALIFVLGLTACGTPEDIREEELGTGDTLPVEELEEVDDVLGDLEGLDEELDLGELEDLDAELDEI